MNDSRPNEIGIAPVRKSIVIEATQRRAFDTFTQGLDRWWPKNHGVGTAPVRRSIFETFVGGRWYAECEDGSEGVVGRVLVWEPPERFVISWEIGADWKSDPRPEMCSEVEVRFLAESPKRTRVELEHRNFERMGEKAGASMRHDVDGGWAPLLELYTKVVSGDPD